MKRITLIIAIVLSGMLMQAQELWRGAEVGMTVNQIKEIFGDKLAPQSGVYTEYYSPYYLKVALVGEYPVRVDFVFTKDTKTLEFVNLEAIEGKADDVWKEFKNILIEKYGEPDDVDVSLYKVKRYIWEKDIQIFLEHITFGDLNKVQIQYHKIKP